MKSRIIVLDKARLDSKKVLKGVCFFANVVGIKNSSLLPSELFTRCGSLRVSSESECNILLSTPQLTSLASLRQQCKPVFVQGRRPTTGYFVINAFFLRRSHSTYVDKVQQQRVSSLTPLLPRSTQLRQSITEHHHPIFTFTISNIRIL
ncbi:hypothetical protein T01_10517 [Trichinella spiralis]|uniref:Uncharacterized protein n=1 Tax=Trichinella spiralis TaxID=6334 RepID=A0A0V1AUV4_TRISP|nr:hypothetical protein T01_10517 [Trichinella spiralis]